MATRQAASQDLDLRLPKPEHLQDVSPLPLSLSAALSTGILTPSSHLTELSTAVETYKTTQGSHRVHLSLDAYKELAGKTVDASRAIHQAGLEVSYLDICLHYRDQEENLAKEGKKLVIVVDNA